MINVSKLLKGCNKGTNLYSKLHVSVQFMGFTEAGNIRVKGQCGSNCYNQFGQPMGYPDSECMLFPNKDCTWENWEVPVEPKFKDDDWIVGSDCFGVMKRRVCGVYDKSYHVSDERTMYRIPFDQQDKWHLWTIEDAEDGDVLACHELIVIFKEIDGLNIRTHLSYHYMNTPMVFTNELHNKKAFRPATKEERDLLFTKMAEDDYSWDSEKKKLIVNFKAGMPVLVRDVDNQTWGLSQFSHRDMGCYICLNREDFVQCIPFEGNEHLIGTTDECDEVYITWQN